MTAYFAIDRQTMANGCIKMLKGSNHLGRIDHGSCSSSLCSFFRSLKNAAALAVSIGDQQGAEPERVELALKRFEEVYFVADPGDALFFHALTLRKCSRFLHVFFRCQKQRLHRLEPREFLGRAATRLCQLLHAGGQHPVQGRLHPMLSVPGAAGRRNHRGRQGPPHQRGVSPASSQRRPDFRTELIVVQGQGDAGRGRRS